MTMPDIPQLFDCAPLRELVLPFRRQSISLLVVKDPWSSLAVDACDPQHDVYWGELWPAALAAADALLENAIALPPPGAGPILEIGCGTGLVTLATAISGGADVRVIAADRELRALDLVLENARRNGVGAQVSTLQLNWQQKYSGRHPLILAADCLYAPDACWQLAAFLRGALDPEFPGARAIVVDPGRWSAANFRFQARQVGFKVEKYTRQIPFLAAQGPIREIPV